MLTNVILGIGLSMDCVAVLLSLHTIDQRKKSLIHFFLPVMFGIAHTVMPFAGWAIGLIFKQLITQYDHWVAFFLLFVVGSRMVYTSLHDTNRGAETVRLVNLKSLLVLTFATSIDSVVIGMTFAFLNQSVFAAFLTIGLTTLVVSFLADFIGDYLGPLFKSSRQGVFGGLVIVAIGVKILLEHLL